MAILVLLIKRDVPQFVTVFIVIIFSLGGALYLSLIGYYSDNNLDTENNNDTRCSDDSCVCVCVCFSVQKNCQLVRLLSCSEIYLLWWTGFRILAEGSALTYYGPGGFKYNIQTC